MYLDHFGLNEPPFRITPHTDFFFSGANRGATLDALIYAITHDEGIVKVGGEVGSGKTMLCRVLMERLPGDVETIYLANPSLSRDEILLAIADELKLEIGSTRTTRVLRSLQEHLIALYADARHVVVLIDEAHAMPMETLEEIRLLSNLETDRHKLLQIVLFGQPELDDHLNAPKMRQLKERITHSFRLEPLVRSDVEGYVDFRMRAAGYRGPNVFSSRAIRLIASASEGLTRRVNILADKSLLAAFADNAHSVTEKEVKRAIRDSDFHRLGKRLSRPALVLGGALAGLAAGFAIHALLRSSDPAPAAEVPRQSAAGASAALPAAGDSATPLARKASATSAPEAAQMPDSTAAALRAAPQSAPAPGPLTIPAQAETAPVEELESHRAPTPPARGRIARERFASTQDWFPAAPGGHVAIQLMTVNSGELSRLENFLLEAAKLVPKEQLHVYSVKIDGGQYYRAAYGSFRGVSEASMALKELPASLKAHSPYYRSIERMRSQNRQ